jgi:hypothetical protein
VVIVPESKIIVNHDLRVLLMRPNSTVQVMYVETMSWIPENNVTLPHQWEIMVLVE